MCCETLFAKSVDQEVIFAYLYLGEDKRTVTGFQLSLQSLKAQYLLAASKTEMLLASGLQIMYKVGLRESLGGLNVNPFDYL